MSNELTEHLSLFIFTDKVKNEMKTEDIMKNNAVIKITIEAKWFANKQMIVRNENLGIEKNNIIALKE